MKPLTPALLRDIVQWDVATWSRALGHWEKTVEWDAVSHCLELGGRQGGLSLWLALHHKAVVCSDLRDTRKTAEPLHIRYNVTDRITYRDIDATAIPFTDAFDVVVFKSILGGVGSNDNKAAQQAVFDQAFAALRPGGCLLFAENLVASPLHRALRKRFNPWSRYWRYPTLEELRVFTRQFGQCDIRTAGVLATLGRSEPQRRLLSAIDSLLLNHVVPSGWHYMAYGVAVK